VIEFHAAKIEALPAEIARRPERDAVSLKKDRA
jgi:hypothetical protein